MLLLRPRAELSRELSCPFGNGEEEQSGLLGVDAKHTSAHPSWDAPAAHAGLLDVVTLASPRRSEGPGDGLPESPYLDGTLVEGPLIERERSRSRVRTQCWTRENHTEAAAK